MEVERWHKQKEALLNVSEDLEVDDTKFEKLVDLLKKACDTPKSAQIFLREGGIDFFLRGLQHQDHRVNSAVFRLIGTFGSTKEGFEALIQHEEQILNPILAVLLGQEDMEPLLRDSALHCFKNILEGESFHLCHEKWFSLHLNALLDAIFLLFSDSNHFIQKSSTLLLSRIIRVYVQRNSQDELLKQHQLQARLDAAVASSKEEIKTCVLNLIIQLLDLPRFLQQTDLVLKTFHYARDRDRLVRSRWVEMLGLILKSENLFLLLPSQASMNLDPVSVEKKVCEWLVTLLTEWLSSKKKEDLLFFLELLGILHFKTNSGVEWMGNLLRTVTLLLDLLREESCLISEEEDVLFSISPEIIQNIKKIQNIFLWNLFESLRNLVSSLRGSMNQQTQLFATLLSYENHLLSLKTKKAWLESLGTFSSEIWTANPRNNPFALLVRVIHTETDRIVVDAALSIFSKQLSKPQVANLFVEMADRDQIKGMVHDLLSNWGWELRDSCIEFLSAFFEQNSLFSFVEDSEWVHFLILRMQDTESFVRASSVQTIKKICSNPVAWKKFVENNQFLPALIHLFVDSETVPRRCVAELMVKCVSIEHSCTTILEWVASNTANYCERIQTMYSDEDWEVKTNAIYFVTHLADHRPETFFTIKGDQFLLQSVRDPSRLVRIAACKALEQLKVKEIPHKKRKTMNEKEEAELKEKWTCFQENVQTVNLEAIAENSLVENLYYEHDEDYLLLQPEKIVHVDCY